MIAFKIYIYIYTATHPIYTATHDTHIRRVPTIPFSAYDPYVPADTAGIPISFSPHVPADTAGIPKPHSPHVPQRHVPPRVHGITDKGNLLETKGKIKMRKRQYQTINPYHHTSIYPTIHIFYRHSSKDMNRVSQRKGPDRVSIKKGYEI